MHKIMSNSSPIIALSMIGQLSLLKELFSDVYLPSEVYREIVESDSVRQHGKNELKQAVEQGHFRISKKLYHQLLMASGEVD
jgi:predicted nucleic acid-binding protein